MCVRVCVSIYLFENIPKSKSKVWQKMQSSLAWELLWKSKSPGRDGTFSQRRFLASEESSPHLAGPTRTPGAFPLETAGGVQSPSPHWRCSTRGSRACPAAPRRLWPLSNRGQRHADLGVALAYPRPSPARRGVMVLGSA